MRIIWEMLHREELYQLVELKNGEYRPMEYVTLFYKDNDEFYNSLKDSVRADQYTKDASGIIKMTRKVLVDGDDRIFILRSQAVNELGRMAL